MSVVSCKEKYGNEGEKTLDGTSYRREFLVQITDPANDRELTIFNSPIVTAKVQLLKTWEAGNDINYGVAAAKLRLRSREDSPYLYDLEAEYESDASDGGGGGPDTDPLDEPPEFEYTWVSYKRFIDSGFDETIGTPNSTQPQRLRPIGFVNSAGEPFDPQPEIDDDRLVLTFSRNEATFNPRVAMAYANSVNADPISGAEAGQLLLKPIRASIAVKNGIWYWKKRYEIHFRWEGWDMRQLDHGSYYWEGGIGAGNPKKIKFQDESGGYTLGFLDEFGDKLLDQEDYGFFVVHPYRLMNFAPLNLPLPSTPNPSNPANKLPPPADNL